MEKLSFKVNEQYEGPLDLILHLIAKHQLNIQDINISSLLEQYMDYIRAWQEQNMEVASEFLEMASRLVYIKTVSLLPKYEEEEKQAKAELVGQLLEYQACKEAAEQLGLRQSGFSAFVRAPQELEADLTYVRRHDPMELARSYWDAVGKGRRRLPPQSEVFTPLVAKPVVSVSSRIVHILRGLYRRTRLSFRGLFEDSGSRSERVATFLAVLELLKAKRIRMEDEDQTVVFAGGGRQRESALGKQEG